ncbi:hypothetical protein TSAR_014106 [Trichomalopsis sarcophagae]|uniref:Uncharacterized protein n=1 Tax=Trichomalopsis sarcophagae TaxID=543379 RepID=A0A232EUJ3_9HYME|nr:hypothetical protein TSAR_014106 [Trichomalopsis sarcophagae]
MDIFEQDFHLHAFFSLSIIRIQGSRVTYPSPSSITYTCMCIPEPNIRRTFLEFRVIEKNHVIDTPRA